MTLNTTIRLAAALATLLFAACGPVSGDDSDGPALEVSAHCRALQEEALDHAYWDVPADQMSRACQSSDALACVLPTGGTAPAYRLYFMEGRTAPIDHELLHIALHCMTGDGDPNHKSVYFRRLEASQW